MKKKKIERIMSRINVLLDENPHLICLNCAEAKEITKYFNQLKSEIEAYKCFLDKFSGIV